MTKNDKVQPIRIIQIRVIANNRRKAVGGNSNRPIAFKPANIREAAPVNSRVEDSPWRGCKPPETIIPQSQSPNGATPTDSTLVVVVLGLIVWLR